MLSAIRMDYVLHVKNVLLLIVAFGIQRCMTQDEVFGVRREVVCLSAENGNEVFLSCQNNTVINIHTALQGAQQADVNILDAVVTTSAPTHTTIGPGGGSCSYIEEPECAAEVSEWQTMLSSCMGQKECNVVVNSMDIPACNRLGDYVQVEYECVQDNTNTDMSIIDICGDLLDGQVVNRQDGYIETPNYPDLYPPELSCTCNLTARNAEIVLTLMDLELDGDPACMSDWLEYQVEGQAWGHGRRICSEERPNSTYHVRDTVKINFKADSEEEGRGFWIKYEARRSDGSLGDVSVSCNSFYPRYEQFSRACVDYNDPAATLEASLDCHDLGIIDIRSIRNGHSQLSSNSHQGTPPAEVLSEGNCTGAQITCVEPRSNSSEIFATCQGRDKCTAQASRELLQLCPEGMSNYFSMEYTCVPDEFDHNNIIDICGSEQSSTVVRRTGYVKSPGYPVAYPHDTECVCEIEADFGTNIELQVVDVSMTPSDCSEDQIEYAIPPHYRRGEGVTLCDLGQHSKVSTNFKHVFLYFTSSETDSDRGFWIKYTGIRDDDQSAPVSVRCGLFNNSTQIQPDDGTINTIIKQPVTSDDSTTNLGLILGLTFFVLVIIVAVAALFAYKKRKGQRKIEEVDTLSPVPPTISSNVDRKYMTLNSFSPLAVSSSYSAMNQGKKQVKIHHQAAPGSSDYAVPGKSHQQRINEYVENNPDYDTIPSARGKRGSLNPMYQQNWMDYNSRL